MTSVAAYIRAAKAATGRLPKLREINEHNGGRLLDTLMQLMELDDETREHYKQMARIERRRAQ